MGDSKPPKATFDLIDSYAKLEGQQAHIVLNDPQFEIVEPATLVLIQGDRRRRAAAAVVDGPSGKQVLASVPRPSLKDGTWNLRLRSGERNSLLNVRLLVQGDRPLVLLWGSKALPSQLPDPHPRPLKPVAKVAAEAKAKGRKLGHTVLTKLPEEPANAVRKVVRKVEERF